MFGRRDSSPAPMDPSVAPVEALLDAAATRLPGTVPSHESRPLATYTLWICACVTAADAPVWLIYQDVDGEIVWGRIPDGAEASDLVDAGSSVGGHTDPGDVLDWLQGKAQYPWASGDGWGDEGVIQELALRIGGS